MIKCIQYNTLIIDILEIYYNLLIIQHYFTVIYFNKTNSINTNNSNVLFIVKISVFKLLYLCIACNYIPMLNST